MVQVSLVQLSLDRRSYGRICQVHDLLRDFAMHEAEKTNFVTIFQNPENVNHPRRVTRRASLQSDYSNEFVKHIDPQTRSLLFCFGNFRMVDNWRRTIDSLNFPEFRLLRVLEIEGVMNMELRGLDQLIHLKYVAIKYCFELKLHIESSLGRLKNLETFDLEETKLNGQFEPIGLSGQFEPFGLWGQFEPIGLWTIDTLRHVRTPVYQTWELPLNANLRNLQTLQTVKVSKEWHRGDQLPCLNSLRELRLAIWETSDAIAPLLGTLTCLVSLDISGNLIPKELCYPTVLPKYQNLQSLHLLGKWPENVSLEGGLFPKHLVQLTLDSSCLGQDPMPELGKLRSLKTLRLRNTVLGNGRHMICPAGFSVLQTLEVASLCDVDLLRVEKGVMPKLKYLRKYSSEGGLKVELPPELQHLDSAQDEGIAGEWKKRRAAVPSLPWLTCYETQKNQ